MSETRWRTAERQILAGHAATNAHYDRILSLWGKPRPASQSDPQRCDGAAVRRAIEAWVHMTGNAIRDVAPSAMDDTIREKVLPIIEQVLLEGVAIGAAVASPQAAARRRSQMDRAKAVMQALAAAEEDSRTKHGKLVRKVDNAAVAKKVGCSVRFVEQVTSAMAAWQRADAIGRRASNRFTDPPSD